VHYLKFATSGEVPIAVGIDLEPLRDETRLTADQRAALAEDLAS